MHLFETYKNAVRRSLQRKEAEAPLRRAEAIFFPSFHPETLLLVFADTTGTTAVLMSVERSMWQAGHANKPRRFTHNVAVSPQRATHFWAQLEALMLTGIDLSPTIGLDGITVEVDCWMPAAKANFEAWSPNPATPVGRLINLIYDVAWDTLTEGPAIERLEQLHGYLRSQLPPASSKAP